MLLVGGPLLATVAAVLVILAVLPSTHPGAYAAGGRALPAAASLQRCGDVLTGPPRTCFTPTNGGGVMEIGDQGTTVKMSTMNVRANWIRLSSSLSVAYVGGKLVAPPGTRFVVIDLTVTNITHAQHEFEASEAIPDGRPAGPFYGRQTGLWLVNAQGKTLPWEGTGPTGTDYSVQSSSAVSAVQTPLFQANLLPGIAESGQLAFYYPEAELREAKRAYLVIKELGEPFNGFRSEALIRLAP